MFEPDLSQEGALMLRRRVLLDDATEGTTYAWRLRLVVDGMAGAVTAALWHGNHGHEDMDVWKPLPAIAPSTQHFRATLAPGGITVHAFRPFPVGGESDTPEQCDVLGLCFSKTVDWPSLGESTKLVTQLCQPDGVEAAWDVLEGIYRQEFVPALGARAVARDAARLAEVREAGVEWASRHSGPTLMFVGLEALAEKGLARRDGDEVVLAPSVGLNGMWVAPEFVASHELAPVVANPEDDEPEAPSGG
jgi:hypothetical protein